ncbi:MAG: NUDIX domain-containing protein [Candidatus Pacebacteria bacterium]|nr:NUDIX domain-containing protein [Candidatus Paceibacterota bacterium]
MNKNEALVEGVCCFFNCGDETILGKRTRGIGAGLWNGYGGKINAGETSQETGVRELQEEADVWVMPKHLKKVGEVYFHNSKQGKNIGTFKVHVFIVIQWGGEIQESEEMKTPTLFLKDKLPYSQMMCGDREWLPPIMRGEKLIAHVFQDIEKNITTASTIIEFVESFEETR